MSSGEHEQPPDVDHPTGQAGPHALLNRGPVFVVAPPRAGARMVGDVLQAATGTWSIAGRRGGLLGGLAGFEPGERADGSRITADHATATVKARLHRHLGAHAVAGARLVDAEPRNALMVGFLAEIFPRARFVYVHHAVQATLIEALESWRSHAAVAHPPPGGWQGPDWSFALVPGWRELSGRPLAEIVCEQWTRIMAALCDDLEHLAPERWCVVDRARLLSSPRAELARIYDFTGLPRSADDRAVLALQPQRVGPEARRRASAELAPYLERTAALAARAADWIAAEPTRRPVSKPPQGSRSEPKPP